MADPTHEGNGQPVHADVKYEKTDAKFKPILIILIGAVIFAIVVHAVIWWFYYDYRGYQDRVKRSPYPLASTPTSDLPRGPRLEQVNRIAEIETGSTYKRLEEREAALRQYRKSEEEGFVCIPVEQAMDYLIQNNELRARKPPSADQQVRSGGLVDAGESNSGRMFRKGKR